MNSAAFFISYDSDTQITAFSMLMDDLGSHRYGRTAWILRTERSREDTWNLLAPFFNRNGTLFMLQIFSGHIACSLPQPFAHDPIKELLVSLETDAPEE